MHYYVTFFVKLLLLYFYKTSAPIRKMDVGLMKVQCLIPGFALSTCFP